MSEYIDIERAWFPPCVHAWDTILLHAHGHMARLWSYIKGSLKGYTAGIFIFVCLWAMVYFYS